MAMRLWLRSLMCCLLECSNRQLQIFYSSRKGKLNQPSLTPNIIEKNDNYLRTCVRQEMLKKHRMVRGLSPCSDSYIRAVPTPFSLNLTV